jgi:hypothetical protein
LQFSVPQFTDVEDKIIGPLTLKQFFFMLGGAVIIFIFFRLVTNLFFFIILSLPVAGVTLLLTFGRFNGQPMVNVMLSLVGFLSEPRSYVYSKEDKPEKKQKPEETVVLDTVDNSEQSRQEKLSRLHKLTYVLDQDVKSESQLIKEKFTNLK